MIFLSLLVLVRYWLSFKLKDGSRIGFSDWQPAQKAMLLVILANLLYNNPVFEFWWVWFGGFGLIWWGRVGLGWLGLGWLGWARLGWVGSYMGQLSQEKSLLHYSWQGVQHSLGVGVGWGADGQSVSLALLIAGSTALTRPHMATDNHVFFESAAALLHTYPDLTLHHRLHPRRSRAVPPPLQLQPSPPPPSPPPPTAPPLVPSGAPLAPPPSP